MKHWIVMFRPETYEAARQHGLMAVLQGHRKRFAEVSPGDLFVVYVSKKSILDAHGVVVSDPFEDAADEPPGWARYTHRARIQFEETGADIDARKLLWGLAACRDSMRISPAGLILAKGGVMQIPQEDYEWLRAVMRGDAPVSPVRS